MIYCRLMKIDKFIPTPPPTFSMTFTRDEGWAIVAALNEYAHRNPDAARVRIWLDWASELDKKLKQ